MLSKTKIFTKNIEYLQENIGKDPSSTCHVILLGVSYLMEKLRSNHLKNKKVKEVDQH